MRKRIIISCVILAIISALGFGGYVLYVRFIVNNPAASCANCRSFIGLTMDSYFRDTGEVWYPKGGKTPADSLAVLLKWSPHPHFFTSHSLRAKLNRYYAEHGTLTYDFMCYRYNEGLRQDDPNDAIVMYYFEPTRWECSSHKMDFIGRPVMSIGGSGPDWDFIPEAEFQTRQKKTLEYVRAHVLRSNDIAAIESSLMLATRSVSTGTNTFRLTAEMYNQGREAISIQFMDNGSLQGSELINPSKDDVNIRLQSGEKFVFPEWKGITISDVWTNGGVVCRKYTFTGTSSGGTSQSRFGRPMNPNDLNTNESARAWIRIRAQTETIKDIDVLIRSPKLFYATTES